MKAGLYRRKAITAAIILSWVAVPWKMQKYASYLPNLPGMCACTSSSGDQCQISVQQGSKVCWSPCSQHPPYAKAAFWLTWASGPCMLITLVDIKHTPRMLSMANKWAELNVTLRNTGGAFVFTCLLASWPFFFVVVCVMTQRKCMRNIISDIKVKRYLNSL